MISKQDVQKIAKLARIELNEEEIKKFQKEFSAILDYFGMLKEIDVSKVEPTFQPTEQFLGLEVMRKDEADAEKPERVNKLVEAAPGRKGRYIKVKTVF